jgi:S-adenosylmethionine:tRNA ribosyltransferase-isomerase
MTARLGFDLPTELEARGPAEARGLKRDGVRMLVAQRDTCELVHTTFDTIPDHLRPGDLVVINTSATIPAAVRGVAPGGLDLAVHFSTKLTTDRWVVEFRNFTGMASKTERWHDDVPIPEHVALGEGAWVGVIGPYHHSDRLFVVRLTLPQPDLAWLAANGQPIRYQYVNNAWPIDAYQNVYAAVPGSAEMASAGRPFTPEVITRLVARGIVVAPIVLHTGVASLEADETPYPEYVHVPETTAALVRLTHESGGRVIAVGTTVVRALETAGHNAFDGWTDLVITPERGVQVVDGLLTGWHEPEASHLLMLEAIAGRPLLEASYEASLAEGYLWHEFGDTHLILP